MLNKINIKEYISGLKGLKQFEGMNLDDIEHEAGKNKCKLGWYLNNVGIRVKFKGSVWFANVLFIKEPYIHQDIWYKLE